MKSRIFFYQIGDTPYMRQMTEIIQRNWGSFVIPEAQPQLNLPDTSLRKMAKTHVRLLVQRFKCMEMQNVCKCMNMAMKQFKPTFKKIQNVVLSEVRNESRAGTTSFHSTRCRKKQSSLLRPSHGHQKNSDNKPCKREAGGERATSNRMLTKSRRRHQLLPERQF